MLGAVPAIGVLPFNMDRKRILLYTLAFVAFAVLVYMQFRTWRNFDWATFWRESGNLGKPPHIYHLFHAVALIYLAYVIARPPLEDLSASRASTGFILEAGRSYPDWVSPAWRCWDVPANSSAPI